MSKILNVFHKPYDEEEEKERRKKLIEALRAQGYQISDDIDSSMSNVNHDANNISDDDLYDRMRQNIKKYEDVKYHPYPDTKGNITTGYGANIDQYSDFDKVNFLVNGEPASEQIKKEAYDKLKKMATMVDQNGKRVFQNHKADFYKNATPLRISEDEALNLVQEHMKNDLAHVRKEFSDFDSFPTPLKETLLDIQYNVKGGLTQKNCPNLYRAIQNKDVFGKNGILKNVHRKDVGKERNDWIEELIHQLGLYW